MIIIRGLNKAFGEKIISPTLIWKFRMEVL